MTPEVKMRLLSKATEIYGPERAKTLVENFENGGWLGAGLSESPDTSNPFSMFSVNRNMADILMEEGL